MSRVVYPQVPCVKIVWVLREFKTTYMGGLWDTIARLHIQLLTNLTGEYSKDNCKYVLISTNDDPRVLSGITGVPPADKLWSFGNIKFLVRDDDMLILYNGTTAYSISNGDDFIDYLNHLRAEGLLDENSTAMEHNSTIEMV